MVSPEICPLTYLKAKKGELSPFLDFWQSMDKCVNLIAFYNAQTRPADKFSHSDYLYRHLSGTYRISSTTNTAAS